MSDRLEHCADFEGTIGARNYDAGTVIVWDARLNPESTKAESVESGRVIEEVAAEESEEGS